MSENNGIKLNLYFKSFTKLTHEEKLKVLELRNYDYVRKNMYNNSIISKEEHFNFINNLKNRSDCIYWAIFSNKNLIGAINLTDIKGNFAEWGFYIDNNCFGLGAVIEYLNKFLQEYMKKTNPFIICTKTDLPILKHPAIISKLIIINIMHLFLQKRIGLNEKKKFTHL